MVSKEPCAAQRHRGGTRAEPQSLLAFRGDRMPSVLRGSAQCRGTHALQPGQQEARQKDFKSLCGSAGGRESGPGRFLIGLELKLQGGQNPTLLWYKERGWGDQGKKPCKFL